VVVDGFPRTRVQAECLKQLHHKMLELRLQHTHHPDAAEFPKPVFRIAVLWVEEKESVERQLSRGRHIIAHNQRVRETGVGRLLEERATDTNEEAVRKRYRIFKEQTLDSLTGLRNHFHYHLINATSDIATVERAIINEFQYQSSLELDDDTLDAINHIPLASTMVHGARQHLVRRLDNYEREHRTLFREVVAFLEREALPAIHLHAITGLAYLLTENPLFTQPLAISMAVDILSERGYFAMVLTEHGYVPVRFDLKTGAIESERRLRFRFQIRFQGSVIRRGH
jgi:adenylate kinase